MSDPAFPAPDERGGAIRRAFVRHPWWFATVFGLILIPAIRPCTRHVPEPPPVWGALPDLSLTNIKGEAFRQESLEDKVWVLSFYTSPCGAACERALESMSALQDLYARDKIPVSLISIAPAAAPEPATIEKSFRKNASDGAERWPLLFGRHPNVMGLKKTITELTRKQRLTDQARPPSEPKVGIGSFRLILIDWRARIRGTYPATPLGVDEIFHRSQHVLRQMSEQLQG